MLSRRIQLGSQFIVFIFTLIYGNVCSLAQEPDYFPISIGNKWIYEFTSANIHWADAIVQIVDTTKINEYTYYILQWAVHDNFYDPGSINYHTEYCRKASNGDVHFYNPIMDIDQLYYTFQDDSIGHPYLYWVSPNVSADQITLLSKEGSVHVSAGHFTNCTAFEINVWNPPFGLIYLGYEIFAPDVGLCLIEMEGDRNQLKGYVIDGVVVGDTIITTVEKPLAQTTFLPAPVLFPSYPNPFNSQTTVEFWVPDKWTEKMEITVYNVYGQYISTLSSAFVSKGKSSVVWNGCNYLGEEVSTGIYFIRLYSPGLKKTVQVSLVR